MSGKNWREISEWAPLQKCLVSITEASLRFIYLVHAHSNARDTKTHSLLRSQLLTISVHALEGAVVKIGLPLFLIALQKETNVRVALFDTRSKQPERHRSEWISF